MKLWGGRFEKPTDKLVEAYTASIPFDWRLYSYDIAGSIAHCRMLGRRGIISPDEAEQIIQALQEIRRELDMLAAAGAPAPDPVLEDVHTMIEARLREKVGDLAGKLHTARSRNDQVALDERLYLREAIAGVAEQALKLQGVLLDLAAQHVDTIMPGYTHLQRAQPVTLGHHLLAYFEMLDRDLARLRDCFGRVNVLPLGAGALAGVPFPIDRQMVARELGFERVAANSIDAVADRDHLLEFHAAAAIIMVHLSRLAEEMVLWSTAEFGFLELDDAFATGSSIMPQKKNPDPAELARGKTGRVYGHLMALLTTMKGLPLAYNRDMQEDKEGL
ncbi:MAG: argininosuccinate lyase, partial [Chloroflexota bacterium]